MMVDSSSMGVLLDGGADGRQKVYRKHFKLVAAKAAHKLVGQVQVGRPVSFDVGNERRPCVGRLVVDVEQPGGGSVLTGLVTEERRALAMAVAEVRLAALSRDGVAVGEFGDDPLAV